MPRCRLARLVAEVRIVNEDAVSARLVPCRTVSRYTRRSSVITATLSRSDSDHQSQQYSHQRGMGFIAVNKVPRRARRLSAAGAQVLLQLSLALRWDDAIRAGQDLGKRPADRLDTKQCLRQSHTELKETRSERREGTSEMSPVGDAAAECGEAAEVETRAAWGPCSQRMQFASRPHFHECITRCRADPPGPLLRC